MAEDPQRHDDTGEADGGHRPVNDVPPADGAAEGAPVPVDVPVRVEERAVLVGEVDVAAARSALTTLGVQGSPSLDRLSVAETKALLSSIVGIEAALDAVRARALVRLEAAVKEDCLQREESPRQAMQVARSEASRMLKESRSVAGRSLATCRRLVQSMPGMLTVLAEGTLNPRSVHTVGSAMGPVPPHVRELVDTMLTAQLPDLQYCGTREISDHVARLLHALDPEGAAERHRRAMKDRHVTITREDHGMASVRALIPAIDAARIRKGLSVAAEGARAAGDRRGHQQIMADMFADALVGRGDGIDPTTLDIGIIITDRSLLAPAHADAATIEGFGPVPYDHVREAMLRALDSGGEDTDLALTIRNLYADLDVGQLVGVEARSRAFPASLRRFLTLAHQTCRAPFCNAPIRQMDHIVPWSQGGATSLDNGNGTCGGDNQKEESGESVRVIHDEDGTRRTVEWTTRYGQKARRAGINFDPVGTYRRQRRRQLAESGIAGLPVPHTAGSPILAPSALPAATAVDGVPLSAAETPPVVEGFLEAATPPVASAHGTGATGEEPALDEGSSAKGWSTIYRAFDRLQLRITDLPIIRPRPVNDGVLVLLDDMARGSSPRPSQPPGPTDVPEPPAH
ncbi:HNH endonuclease signature motif containing protein [Brachybacterium atlanticum]|uniref:HNH endonuclease signature motif containing protein n=1 Tax=Brachybacterium atlanticum TaxID=2911888 RepID=UPI0021E0D963|nr:DUF222 domain-containing protein [Brachybacterium atlanticum]